MNEPNVLKRICRCLCTVIILCAVSVVPASAQAPNVTLEAKNVTVKELLRLIEANSPYIVRLCRRRHHPRKTGLGKGR